MSSAGRASAQKSSPGLGPAGTLLGLEFEPAGEPLLHGPDSRRQLVVTGKYSSGQRRDLTRTVAFSLSKTGVVEMGEGGFLKPMGNGEVTITAKAGNGVTASLVLKVDQFENRRAINFANQIVPIFTRLGCNTGACHGKASGQNGFKLSLLGFYPKEDYDFLVKEGRGRRVFPSSPEYSLLLQKATNQLPHGGGRRMDADSFGGQLIHRWIEQGMPFGGKDDAVVKRIEVFPRTRTMNRGGEQQLAVVAHYSDGSSQDVTRLVKYESNDLEMAEVTEGGLVKTLDTPGQTAVMVRFQDHVTVFRASLPLGLKFTIPPARNFIDKHVFANLQTLGIPPSKLCDDATFLRRVTVDIAGRLPTGDESQRFLADKTVTKRDRLIDTLLASPGYADCFANKWNAVLKNRRTNTNGRTATIGFHAFLKRSFQQNVRYDKFVRSILTATGDGRSNAPAAWFAQVTTPVTQAEDAAQLFLGLRIQCAHCHHHPYEKWSQDDYFGLTAFFTRVKRTVGKQKKDRSSVIAHNPGLAKSRNPRSGRDLLPTPLGGVPLKIAAKTDPRPLLVDWMVRPENPFFARSLVNRYWKHFFNRGIVEPEDDMRVTNPPSNPELLDALAAHFIKSGFDLKDLVRTICRSRVYQLSSKPNEYNGDDKQNFSSYYAKRLHAEVLFDALNQATNTTTTFKGLPAGTRAIQLPDSSFNNYFLSIFGKPQAATACECERSSEANLAQSLHLLNSPQVQAKIASAKGRAALLAKDKRTDALKVRELYLWVFAREPKERELQLILPHLAKSPDKKRAYEDILWALINTKEFQFNH
ncbi:MAG: DUF1553 domain-containing protein [Planctomycetes bacterium]|nr:DUF1553 domain-containing protein [Planctomycetota bacterium]